MENFKENDEKFDFLFIWGPKVAKKIAPLRPIFSTLLKVFAMGMRSNTDVKPVKTFLKNDQRPEFLHILWPKIVPKLGLCGPYIPHTAESTCNEHVKQHYCETNENFLRTWPKSRILTYFGVQNGPKIEPLRPKLYTSLKVCPMSIQSNTDVYPEDTAQQNSGKPEFWLIWSPEMAQTLLDTYKNSPSELINKVSRESSGHFSRN